MKNLALSVLLILSVSGCATYSGQMSKGAYVPPSQQFSVQTTINVPDVTDGKDPAGLQFVDFYAAKYYPTMGFESLEWMDAKVLASEPRAKIADIGNNFESSENKHYLQAVLKSKLKSYSMVLKEDLKCDTKTVNEHKAYQCSALAEFTGTHETKLFTMTTISFKNSMAVAVTYGVNPDERDKFINSIQQLR